MLYSICRKYSRRGTTVEDLLQEASLALWLNRDKLMAVAAGPRRAAWVWKTARNAVVDTLRRIKETEPLPDNMDELEGCVSANEMDSVQAYHKQDLINELYEQIGHLDEPDKTIVMMQLQGYSYEEIGEALGMTEKNVSVRLVRTKDKLKKAMSNN